MIHSVILVIVGHLLTQSNVTVTLVNDSANLDNWYISEGLSPNGNSINCFFENQLFWYIGTFASGTPYGFCLVDLSILISNFFLLNQYFMYSA